jgi:hypothetical protein
MPNPIRGCSACGQADDSPRCCHQESDGSWSDFHFDCCAARGCQIAQAQLQGLEQVPIGEGMRAHLTRKV